MALPQSYGAAPAGLSAAPSAEQLRYPGKQFAPPSGPGTRLRRLGSAVASFVVPCAIFAGVCGCVSLDAPSASLVVIAAAALALALVAFAAFTWRRRGGADAGWQVLLGAGAFVAWVLALSSGSVNRKALQLFYDMTSMATYVDIDPDASGVNLMDAGRILFEPGSYVDRARAVGFRSSKTYCVAPIASRRGAGAATHHDFWAAGVDCCAGTGENFTCGDVFNKRAYAGMRLLDSDRRPYYRLAVQEAEAQFGIRADRPMFFEWRYDPVSEVASVWDRVGHRVLMQVLGFSVVQFFVVAACSVAFSRPKDKEEDLQEN
mmetsp:Transcript_113915/g.318235  ORF Transcript_113915/g.318235 Transcript_113915/m.318235 type:complete len:318 (+) Transcript_113915:121-1074(+)